MVEVVDAFGRAFSMPQPPERIVSLVPSLSQTLFDFGLEDNVLGITRFCVHPAQWRKSKTKVGGTKDFDVDRIRALKPDFVLANLEENTREGIEALAAEMPVFVSHIFSFESALNALEAIGSVCGISETGADWSLRIQKTWFPLQNLTNRKVLYLIWRKPYMTVGTDTYIHSVMKHLGFENVCRLKRYPILESEDGLWREAEEVFLSSEPYPFSFKHLNEIQHLAPQARIWLVNGEAFSWYGTGMLKAAGYLDQLVHDLKRASTV